MRVTHPLLSFLCVCLLSFPVNSQQAGASPQRDPSAVAIGTNALATMGASALSSQSNSKATGVFTMNFQTPVSMSITLESLGLTKTRTVLQQPAGTSIRVVNNGQGVLQRPDGKVVRLDARNTLAEHVSAVPVLSLLAEVQSSLATVTLVSASSANGTPDDVIVVSLGSVPSFPTDASQVQTLNQLTRVKFYINHTSGLLGKIEYVRYADDGFSASSNVQEVLSDYRNVAGVAVPFHRTTYVDGQLESDLQLTSITFNVALPASDFDLMPVTAVQP